MQSSLIAYRTFFSLTATTAAVRYISPSNDNAGSVFTSQWYPIRSAQICASSRMVVVRCPLMVFLLFICAGIHALFFRKECGGGRYALLWEGTAIVTEVTFRLLVDVLIFRLSPAQWFCEMPPCSWRHFIPPGLQRAGNFLHLRVFCQESRIFCISSLSLCRRSSYVCYRQCRVAGGRLPGGQGKHPNFLKIDTPFLETPNRDHFITRHQLTHDLPEILCGLVRHAPHGMITITDNERDMSTGCWLREHLLQHPLSGRRALRKAHQSCRQGYAHLYPGS